MTERLRPEVILIPKIHDPQEAKSIVWNQVYAGDSRILEVKVPGRRKPWEWSSDKLRKYKDTDIAAGIVGLIAFQIVVGKARVILNPPTISS